MKGVIEWRCYVIDASAIWENFNWLIRSEIEVLPDLAVWAGFVAPPALLHDDVALAVELPQDRAAEAVRLHGHP